MMAREKVVGLSILGVSVFGIVLYIWLVFFSDWSLLTLQLTAAIAIVGVLGLLSWIGYTLATTPPPTAFVPPEDEVGQK